jgi:hypothetical protein
MPDVGAIAITVISQPTSRRSQQHVFSRVITERGYSAPSTFPGGRIFVLKRRARGIREPIVVYTRGFVEWSNAPAGGPSAELGSLYVSWPMRDHRYRHDGRKYR